MNQVANTVMIPRGEYEELKQHRDELLAALKDVLHTREQEAKAQRAYEVANENYSDPKPESEAWGNAMIEASMAEKRALAIIAKGGAMITRSSPEYLRGIDEPEAADLIKQQAERIKELEASLASMVQGVKISIPTQTMEQEFQSHYRRGYEAGKAALRQRIDDAPVVAWLHTQSNGCSSLIRTPPSAFDPQDLADAEVSIYALISKEDLK